MTPEEKALEFLKTHNVEKMSGYISARLYNTFEFTSKHKTLFEVITDYNSYRNGIYENFGKKSMQELLAALFNLFGVMVPKEFFYKGAMPIKITKENVLALFADKNKFK